MGLNIEDLIESNDAMTEAIQRVRELHRDRSFDVVYRMKHWCGVCCVKYPCPTIQALDGEQ